MVAGRHSGLLPHGFAENRNGLCRIDPDVDAPVFTR
jgi:hypothetical protein